MWRPARGVVGSLLVADPLRGGQRRSRRNVPRSKLVRTRPSASHAAKWQAAKDLQPADDMSCMDGGRKGTRGGPVTREQAAKTRRVYRIYFSYAVVMMWVIVLLDAVWLHTSLLPVRGASPSCTRLLRPG